MNYVEIYNKIYKALLKDGYEDDHHEYGIVQITRAAASEITYSLWRFLLSCENHPMPSMIKEVDQIIEDTLLSISNAVENNKKEKI